MNYAAVMVALTVGRSNEHILRAARAIGERFQARVIGLAACRPIQVVCQDYPLPAACFDEDRKQIARQLEETEREFRACLSDLGDRIEWRPRTTLVLLSVFLAQEARSADLVIVSPGRPGPAVDATREIDLTDLVMQCSRPVLLVPQGAATDFENVLLAWKDTRQAQRAAADALPFLAKARSVTVVSVAADDKLAHARAEVDQVADWLAQHGVSARTRIDVATVSNADQLNAIADELGADLLVAGAYGYMRGRTWVLGGVTSQALHNGRRCMLLSH